MPVEASVVSDIRCPHCHAAVECSSGGLRCVGCARTFRVDGRVIDFVDALGEQEQTSRSFGFQWKGFWKGLFDRGDVYGVGFEETRRYFLASTGLTESQLAGMKILDAGTGSGRVAHALTGTGCRLYAVDIHDGLRTIAAQLAERGDVTFFHADLLNLPFKDATFDCIWSSGVLHHTPDTRAAFHSVSRTLKPGGRAFIWLYGTELNHYRIFRHLLPFAHWLPTRVVYALSAALALPLYAGFNVALALLRLRSAGKPPPYRLLGFTVEDLRPKSYRAILLNLFDQLHPRYQREHSVAEVRSWFEEEGFDEIATTEATNTALRGTKRPPLR